MIGLERPFVRDLSAVDRQVLAETTELQPSARPGAVVQPERPTEACGYSRVVTFTRITVDRLGTNGRAPCVRGLRFPVATVVAMVAEEMTTEEMTTEEILCRRASRS